MRIFRSGSGDGLKPSHTGADIGQTASGLQQGMARRWLSAAKFIAAPLIILVTAVIVVPVLIRANQPSLEMRCMTQMKQVGMAISMYTNDQGGYPLSANWHTAIRSYIDDPLDPYGRVEPGSARDPLSCPSDPTDSPVSYLYLNRALLDHSKQMLAESVTPLVVDEYFHGNVLVAYGDGRTEKMEKQLWLHYRNRQWEIRRDLDRPAAFAYEPIPGSVRGPTGPTPEYDRTKTYVWPKF